jgi:16S rRNA processing protein RimM
MDKESSKNYITIGEIVNTQGNRGYVRVLPLTDFPERFKGMKQVSVYTKGAYRLMHPEDVYNHKKFVVIKFKEIPDMTAAESLKGGLLQVEPKDIVPLPRGSYYVFNLMGMDVYNSEGRHYGRIKDILTTGANDVYIVWYEAEKRDLLIPALKQVVKLIDVENKKMVVDLPEGL